MKKTVAILLFAVMMIQLLPIGAAILDSDSSSGTEIIALPGSGTASDPYVLQDEEQLAFMAKQVNSGNTYYMNAYYSLKNDVTLSSSWTPIGDLAYPFKGTFNGNGFAIKNMSITDPYKYSGFFGVTNGNVQNITLDNYSIKNTSQYSGAVAGYNGGNIVNCHSTGTIAVSNHNLEIGVGGIVGSNAGSVFFCSALNPDPATINITAYSTNSSGYYKDPPAYAGGLAGINSHKINTSFSQCSVYVQAANPNPGYAAGFVGLNSGNVTECYASGNVEIDSYYLAKAAGFVANNKGGTIANCFAVGNVKTLTGDNMSSQVIGGLVADNSGAIKNSLRSKTQSITLKKYAFWETGTVNKQGDEHDNLIDFYSIEFLTSKLHWEKTNWVKAAKGCPILLSGDNAVNTYTLDKVYGTDAIIIEYNTLNVLNDAESYYNSENGTLKVSHDSYYDVNVENCTLVTFNRFALIPQSTKANISAVHCDGNDALANEIFLSAGSNEAVDLKVYPAANASISEYQFLDAYPSLTGIAQIVAKSTDGSFSIVPGDLDDDNTYWVRAIGTDGTKYTPIQTNIKLVDDISADEIMSKLDLGINLLTIDVPDGIPLIGGEEFNIGTKDLPIGYIHEKDRILITIGVKKILSSDYPDYKKALTDLQNGIANNKTEKYFAPDKNKSPWEFDYYGYVEIPLDSRGCAHLNGITTKVILTLKGSWEHKWQYFAFSVPIVVKVKVEASGTATLSFAFDENLNFDFRGSVSLEAPKLTPSAGIGFVEGLDISAYGSASHKLDIDFYPKRVVSTLSGEVGLCATLLFFEMEEPLISGDITIYDSSAGSTYRMLRSNAVRALTNTANYSLDRGYNEDTSPWLGGASVSLFSGNTTNEKTLQSSVYHSAAPKTVQLNDGSVIMVWTADISDRTDYNHTAVVWSRYTADTDTWSEPIIINDNGTADFSPDLITDGENVYVVWLDANTVFDSAAEVADVASRCEVALSKLAYGSDTFDAPFYVSSDNYYDSGAKLSLIDGEYYLCWLKNTANDVTLLSGTNSIMWAKLSDLSATYTAATLDTPVTAFEICSCNGNASIVYTTDPDTDYSTPSLQLFVKDLSSETAPIMIDEGRLSDVTPITYNSKNGFMAYKDGYILFYNGESSPETVIELTGGQGFITVPTENGMAIVYVAGSSGGSESTSAYIVFYDGAKWSSPVLLSNCNGYIKGLSATVDQEGQYTVYYTKTTAAFVDGMLTRVTDLCTNTVTSRNGLTLTSAYCGNVTSDAKLPFDIKVKNNGFSDVTSYTVNILNGNNTTVYSEIINEPLAIGEERNHNISVTLPSLADDLTNYTVTVTPNNVTDTDTSDNSLTVTLGYTDLSVSVNRLTSGQSTGAVVNVTNNGVREETVTLNLRADTADGKILTKFLLGNVAPGETASYVIDAARFRGFDLDCSLYVLEVCGENEELYLEDNSDVLVIDQKTITLPNNKTVPAYYDVNGDERINVLDVIFMKKIISEKEGKSNALIYDLNGDLVLNGDDAKKLMGLIIG